MNIRHAQLPKGWEAKNLGDVSLVIAGQSPEGKYYNQDGKGMPFYQGKKEFNDKYLGAPTTWTSEITKIAERDDILMSVRAPVGPINVSTQKICIGRGLAAIRASNSIDKEYLFNFLLKHESEIVGNTGAVFNSINKSQIENIPIPLPPLSEQKQIVAVLDESFTALAKAKENAEKNLANAEEVFTSSLQEMVSIPKKGWQEKKLEELFNIKHGFAFLGQYFSNKGKYILLTPGNFYEEGGYRDRGEKTKYYTGEIPKDYIAKKNDLMIAMTEQAAGLLGSPIIVPESNKYLHNQRLGLIQFKQENIIGTNYLFYLFNTKRIRNLIHQSASGVKVRHTSPSKVLEIKVSIPQYEEQQKIAKILNEVKTEAKKLEAIYQQKLSDLEELKKSLLQKAFNGEL